jgi:hypothetical protein
MKVSIISSEPSTETAHHINFALNTIYAAYFSQTVPWGFFVQQIGCHYINVYWFILMVYVCVSMRPASLRSR